MVTRDLTRRSGVGVGYAYGAGFPDGGSLREHRFVQQYTLERRCQPARVAQEPRRGALRHGPRRHAASGTPAGARDLAAGERGTAAGSGLGGVARADQLHGADVSGASTAIGCSSGIGTDADARDSAVEIGYLNVYSRTGRVGHRRSHVMSATLAVSL